MTYASLKSIDLDPVIPMTRKSILKSSLRTAACTTNIVFVYMYNIHREIAHEPAWKKWNTLVLSISESSIQYFHYF